MKALAIGLKISEDNKISLCAEMHGEFSPEQELLISHCLKDCLKSIAKKICDPDALLNYKPAFQAPSQEKDRRGQGH